MSDASTPDAPTDAPFGAEESGDGRDSPSGTERTDGADRQHVDGVNETERLYGVDENPS